MIGERHLHVSDAVDNVMIRHDVSPRIDDDAGSHTVDTACCVLLRTSPRRSDRLLAANVDDRVAILLHGADNRRATQLRRVGGWIMQSDKNRQDTEQWYGSP